MSISDLSLWPPTQRNARRRLTFAFFLSLLLACTLAPKLSAQMKLLSPDTGWFANHGHLFWTSDNGAHWKDITPSGSAIPKGAQFGGVFFLNAAEGWATLSYPEPLAAPTPQARANQKALYMIAHTENSGETWDVRPLTYPPLPASEQDAIAGPASLYFLDSMHGWLDVVAYQSMFNPGKLLATEDGGQTWNWVGSPIHCGPIYFHSLKDGWLISDAGARELYVTHDGAKSWQETRLQAPSELGAAVYPTFMEMPMFKDSQNGYLAVHYSAPGFSSLKLVVYATQSGGKSWQPVKVLPGPAYPLVALTDSVVILPTISGKGKPTTEVVPLTSQAQPTRPVSSQRQNAITAFSFLNGSDGWAIKDGLYATDDGGATWKNISPPSKCSLLRNPEARPSFPPARCWQFLLAGQRLPWSKRNHIRPCCSYNQPGDTRSSTI